MSTNIFMHFGKGDYGVVVGTYETQPAVFVFPVAEKGVVGELIPQPYPLNELAPHEVVLTFPTIDQAEAVADALVNHIAART